MPLDYVRRLLDFHYWARDRMLAALAPLSQEQYEHALGSSFGTIRDTVNHMYLAECVWCRRWQGESPRGAPKDELTDLATLTAHWVAHERTLRAFVESLGDDGLERSIAYRTLAGDEATSRYWETIVHVVNHATYHRGQVTTMLRQLGAAPPASTDMITFFREGPSLTKTLPAARQA